MRLYISMFLFFPWRDGFTSVWNVLTEKQMAERSKYNFAHVLNGVVFYKVPFAQKAVLHSLYRLAKNIFKKSSFQYISSLWIFGTTNTSILRFPWTVSIEPLVIPALPQPNQFCTNSSRYLTTTKLSWQNINTLEKKHTWKEKTKEKWKSPSNIKNLIFDCDKCTDSYMYIYDNMGLS